jgi:hypothetical protein
MPPEEVCETPRPLQLFQARDHHIAHQLAQQLGYVILFREHDKYDTFRTCEKQASSRFKKESSSMTW